MDNFNEQTWYEIPNYPDYKISTKGQVLSCRSNNLLVPGDHNTIVLHEHPWSIQVLMGCVFLGNDITNPYRNRVLFKDNNTSNLDISNLYIEDTSDLPGEEWRSFSEFNGRKLKDYYMISNKGRVKSCKHCIQCTYKGVTVDRYYPDLIIRIAKITKGYFQAVLHTEQGKEITVPVHRMVAIAFCFNSDPTTKNVVNHVARPVPIVPMIPQNIGQNASILNILSFH